MTAYRVTYVGRSPDAQVEGWAVERSDDGVNWAVTSRVFESKPKAEEETAKLILKDGNA